MRDKFNGNINDGIENDNEDIEDINDGDVDLEEDEEENEGGENISEIIGDIPEIEMTQEMIDAGHFIPETEKKRVAEELFDWIEIFSSALFTVILLFTFIFRLVTVQGPSMEYTLHGGYEIKNGAWVEANATKDNLIISNLLYNPKQGDIVVIQVPSPSFPTPIIKRVIAVEGQTVDFDFENWLVIVDGVPLDEPYVNFELGRFMNSESISPDMLPITVEPGKIFVMGDNRNHSSDSRSSQIGQVDRRNVVGRVLLRVYPLNKFGIVKKNGS